MLYFKLFARNLKNQIGNIIYFHTFQTRSHFSIRANSWHNKKSYLQNLPSKGLNEWWFIYVTLLKIQNKMKLLPHRKLWSYPVKNKTDNYIKINFCWNSHKKRKDSLETRGVLLIFSLELETSGVAVQSIHQNSKKWRLLLGIAQWKWIWGYFSHLLLLWPWCQGFWGRSKKVSQMLLVCYNLLNSQSILIYQ